MFRLRLLGTPHLEGSSGVVPQGPRRIAILACLAAAGPGGLTRDKLIARLWPDTDEDRARRNLSQLLYAMKTELGVELVEGTGTVRLDPAACSCDLGEFDAAVAARQDGDVVRLYTGPLLDGFHLAESSEFSQWADAERDRRATQVRAAARRLAESAGTSAEAVGAWRKALSLEPLSAPVTLKLMEALVTSGDHTGALRVADQHAALARTELDSEPDPGVARRASELRRAGPAPAYADGGAAPTAPAHAGDATDAKDAADAAPTVAAATAPWWRTKRARLAAAAALPAVIALVAWGQRAPAPLGDDEYVLIAQVEDRTGDSTLDRTLAAAMAAAMQQSAHVVPLPRARVTAAMRRMKRRDSTEFLPLESAREVAQREGVRFVITGELISVGSARQLIARIIEAQTGAVTAAHTFDASGDAAVLTAIDQAARRLRRDLGEARSTVAATRPLPEVTTASLAALHEFALGLDAERSSRTDMAWKYYENAIALDSTFAVPYAKLAEGYAFNNKVPESNRYAERALALAEHLPVEEQLRIRMSVAWARGDREAMVFYGRQYLELRPRDFAARARLAFSLFSAGQHEEARAAYATADRLSPLSPGSVLNWGTAWLSGARVEGRSAFDSARYYYERAFKADSSLQYDAFFNHQYGAILIGAGLPDSARATYERMAARTPLDRARGLRSLAYLEAYEGEWSHVVDRFDAAADIGRSQKQWTTAIRNEALAAEAAIALGDRARAQRAVDRATAIALREPLEARMVAFVALDAVRLGDIASARTLLARMRGIARPEHDAEQAALAVVEGSIELAAGNQSLAFERIESGFRRDASNLGGSLIRARALEAAGQDADALQAWTDAAAGFEFGNEGQFEWQFADAERARLLERLKRPDEAVDALRRLVARYPARPGALEPVTLRDARERLRRLESARPKS